MISLPKPPRDIGQSDRLAWDATKLYKCFCCSDTGFVVFGFGEKLIDETTGNEFLPYPEGWDALDNAIAYPQQCRASHCQGKKPVSENDSWHRPEGGVIDTSNEFRLYCDLVHRLRLQSARRTNEDNHKRRKEGRSPEAENFQRLQEMITPIATKRPEAIADPVEPTPAENALEAPSEPCPYTIALEQGFKAGQRVKIDLSEFDSDSRRELAKSQIRDGREGVILSFQLNRARWEFRQKVLVEALIDCTEGDRVVVPIGWLKIVGGGS